MTEAMISMYVIPQVLGAIWLNIPVLTDQGVKRRITKGMKINYKDGLISLTDDSFNYLILECYGTLVDQFKIKVENLETKEQSIIQL